MEACYNYPKIGLLRKQGDHYYYKYNDGLQNQAIYYKVKDQNRWDINQDDPVADSEVFLNPNELSEEGIASLGSAAWSPDGKYYAYAIKMGGSDWSTIHIRDSHSKTDFLKDKL